MGISLTVLVLAEDFGPRLKAETVAAAVGDGLAEGGVLEADLSPMNEVPSDAQLDAHMKAARAVVIASPRLDEDTLLGSWPFEIATKARQAGVPAYAVTAINELDLFDARILDLQVVIEARSQPALRRAGAKLARIV